MKKKVGLSHTQWGSNWLSIIIIIVLKPGHLCLEVETGDYDENWEAYKEKWEN